MKKKEPLTSLFAAAIIGVMLIWTPASAQDASWTLFTEVDGVEVYQKSANCHDLSEGYHRRHVLLRFVNTTDQQVEISWFIETWYDGNCSTCHEPEDPEHFRSITLEPGESTEGTCSFHEGATLKVFETFLTPEGEKLQDDVAELSNFDLHNLTVTLQ